jgi:hypothetical protein
LATRLFITKGLSVNGQPFCLEGMDTMNAPSIGKVFKTALCSVAMMAMVIAPVHAYTVNIATGTKAAYLRVGDGTIGGGFYNAGGTPAANTTVNLVSVSVPAASVGNTVDQAMTGTGRLTSDYDGFAFCNAGQVYVSAFYRLNSTATQSATLSVTAPTTLTNATGDTIPMSQILWTSSGNGDTGAQPIPAGTFTGGTQTLTTLLRNTWNESCHSFFYANDAIVAAGTYNARVTYTLTTP